ncbi:MAG: phage tail assembly protein [Pseudogulbenkiania sp.]|nr:phage tail assembly protein [Pseudogulbenkiania sp.]
MNETIKLSSPVSLNGVLVNQLTLREPTVGDQLSARKMAGNDDEQFELTMLANLAGCAPTDLHQVTLRDYDKLQKAYLRLSSPEPSADGKQPAVVGMGAETR